MWRVCERMMDFEEVLNRDACVPVQKSKDIKRKSEKSPEFRENKNQLITSPKPKPKIFKATKVPNDAKAEARASILRRGMFFTYFLSLRLCIIQRKGARTRYASCRLTLKYVWRQYKTKLEAASRSCSAFSFHTFSGTREAKVYSVSRLAPTTHTVYEGGCCALT